MTTISKAMGSTSHADLNLWQSPEAFAYPPRYTSTCREGWLPLRESRRTNAQEHCRPCAHLFAWTRNYCRTTEERPAVEQVRTVLALVSSRACLFGCRAVADVAIYRP